MQPTVLIRVNIYHINYVLLFDKCKQQKKVMKRLKSFETKPNEGLSRNPV